MTYIHCKWNTKRSTRYNLLIFVGSSVHDRAAPGTSHCCVFINTFMLSIGIFKAREGFVRREHICAALECACATFFPFFLFLIFLYSDRNMHIHIRSIEVCERQTAIPTQWKNDASESSIYSNNYIRERVLPATRCHCSVLMARVVHLSFLDGNTIFGFSDRFGRHHFHHEDIHKPKWSGGMWIETHIRIQIHWTE